MKLLPIGIPTFSEIIKNNYVYVDKTKDIYNMVTTGKIYFLSRPRRFGKSLLLSTLESLFKGEKDLFKDLYIHDKWDWEQSYPVIHLDMSEVKSKSSEILENSLINQIKRIAKEKKINLESDILIDIFAELIDEIHTKFGKKVVVLVDEYDAPLVDNISDETVLESNKSVMNGFYKILKSKNEYLRFVFLTGVSKFSGVSVFSGLNSPDDISLNRDFACICGYTQEDLEYYFKEYIDKLALEYGYSYEECLSEIDFYYDGYSWDGINKLYNPFSTLKLFRERNFANYWYATGVTTSLMNVLKKLVLEKNDVMALFKKSGLNNTGLMSFSSMSKDITPLMFQSGYLTIKTREIRRGPVRYSIGFPNFEVEESFYLNLLAEITDKSESEIQSINYDLKEYLVNADEENMKLELKVMLSNIPNLIHEHSHNYYQTAIMSWLFGAGFKIIGEYNLAKRRVDAVVTIEDTTVVVELKFDDDKSLDELLNDGLNQIHDFKYYEPFLKDDNVILLSIAVSNKEIDCKFEKLK
ncbi:MAG: AAA family ATPase [Methanobrevibacter sp. CfCl-M3]